MRLRLSYLPLPLCFLAAAICEYSRRSESAEITVVPPSTMASASVNVEGARSYIWTVIRANLQPVKFTANGPRVMFETSKNTRYYLSCTILTADGRLDQAVTYYTTGDNPDPGPGPGPGPDPPPDPPDPVDPTFPDGKFGAAKLAYEWAKAVKSDRNLGPKLASVFEGTAAAIGAGGINDLPAALKMVAEGNKAVLNGSMAWEPWKQSYVKEMGRLWDERKLLDGDLSTYATFWTEIASGLKAVK